MREKAIEKKLVQSVKSAGGIALKFVSHGFDGMPDRIVLIPDGHIGFVEVKAPGKPRHYSFRARTAGGSASGVYLMMNSRLEGFSMKYEPHNYQTYATVTSASISAVLLDMGLGKTSITLTALNNLFDSFEAHRILVIAPLR